MSLHIPEGKIMEPHTGSHSANTPKRSHQEGHAGGIQMAKHHYRRFAVMTLLSFVSMYVLMYAMVDSWPSVYANLNQAYMAGLMTAPMVLLELVLMRAMYKNLWR